MFVLFMGCSAVENNSTPKKKTTADMITYNNSINHKAVIPKMSGQVLRKRISTSVSNWKFRLAMTELFTDQVLLEKIATIDRNWRVREEAVRKLDNQDLLIKIAMKDTNQYVREEAVRKLNKQALLVKISTKGEKAKRK